MTPPYIEIPVEINAETLVEEVFADLELQIAGWEPESGNLEVFLTRAIVYRLIQPLAQLCADVPAEIFDRWGEEILELTRHEATSATITSTWTMVDNAGHKIPAGTEVGLTRPGDDPVGFRTVFEVEVPAGETTTEPGEVVLEAIDPGEEGNDLEDEASLEDALGFVDSIALVGKSTNGSDLEDAFEYLGRLRETTKTLSPRPVTAEDVAILARNITGIGRSTAIDNYNAETEEDEQERTTTVAVTGPDGGSAASAEAKAAVAADFEAKREANYIFFVIDPTYNGFDVACKIEPMAGFDKATVAANVKAAIEDWLSPSRHGQQPPGDEKSWVNDNKKRYQDLVTVVNNVEGMDFYTELKFALEGDPKEEKDVEMDGVAPLPEPATITVS